MMEFYEEIKELSHSINVGSDEDEREPDQNDEEFLELSVKMIALSIRDAAALGNKKVTYDCIDMRKKLFDILPQRFRDEHGARFMIIRDSGCRKLTFDWAEKNHV